MDEVAEGPLGRGLDAVAGLARNAVVPAKGLAALVLRPPWVPEALSPARALHDVSVRVQRGRDLSAVALHELLETLLDAQVPKIADAVLARLDLTTLIADHVDVAQIVESVLDRLDLTELARTRIDLAQLTNEVIDEINLPAIIRESTSGVASDVVTGARASAATADEAVARFLTRRRRRRAETVANDNTDRTGEPTS